MRRPDIEDLHTALAYFNDLMDTPHEEYVRSSVFQLFSLDAIEFLNSGGDNKNNNNKNNNNKNKKKLKISTFPNAIITQLGKDMSKFRRTDIKLAKMLVASKEVEKKYNIQCIGLVCSLAGVIIAFDGKLSNMFLQQFNDKDKKKYKSHMKKISTKYGDLMTNLIHNPRNLNLIY